MNEAQLATSTNIIALHSDHPWPPHPTPRPSPLRKTLLVSSIAIGTQFGWAIQLTLLEPYVRLLNITHNVSVLIWLCGPISGLILQPTLGYYSDRFGRRRPFIVAGTGLTVLAQVLVGYAADLSNDPSSHTIHNFGYFVSGLCVLDAGTNMIQLAVRALLAEMAAVDHAKIHVANASVSFCMALGNVVGYLASSARSIHLVFPFTRTSACDVACANLKSCIIFSIALQIALTSLALSYVTEKTYIPVPPSTGFEGQGEPHEVIKRLRRIGFLVAFKGLSRPMWILIFVTFLNCIAWFPLFDTDWMGKDIYGGPDGKHKYKLGVRVGALGLVLSSVVMGVMSIAIEPLRRLVRGAKRLWGIANLVMAICLVMIVLLTKTAQHARHQAELGGGVAEAPMPSAGINACALVLFSLLGIPLAITYSTPFALASIFSVSSGAGQAFSLGVLRLAILIPEILVSTTSGPRNALFGRGNLPAFVVGAIVATASSILSFTILPEPN